MTRCNPIQWAVSKLGVPLEHRTLVQEFMIDLADDCPEKSAVVRGPRIGVGEHKKHQKATSR